MTSPLDAGGAPTIAPLTPEARIEHICAALKRGEPEPSTTVRQFLAWFGAYRRGYWITKRIRTALDNAGVVTYPDFENAFIDAQIDFILPGVPAVPTPGVEQGESVHNVSLNLHADVGGTIGVADPTHRIGKLSAANRTPVSVKPDDSITTAITLMLANDYSQLPVMASERAVKGMVSWKSIGARWALDRSGDHVRDFLDEAPEIASDRSLFSAIPTIIELGFILVRDSSQRIGGIVTASDLSEQFQQLAEPFLLLGEIENHIRRLIDRKFSKEDIASIKEPNDPRKIETVADLNFGQYVRLLEEPSRWKKGGLPIDRVTFTKQLDKVREIRNDVMHFDPDGIASQDLETLRQFARFLQTLHALGV
jgi:CBS domain-containing protein